jgi:hypothetical protein
MTHVEKLLGALYVSEGWYMFWKEHKDVSFKTQSLITFDRAINCKTWHDFEVINATEAKLKQLNT